MFYSRLVLDISHLVLSLRGDIDGLGGPEGHLVDETGSDATQDRSNPVDLDQECRF